MRFLIYLICILSILTVMASCKNDISLQNADDQLAELPVLSLSLIETGETTAEIFWQLSGRVPDGHEVGMTIGLRRWRTFGAQKMNSGGITATGLIGRTTYSGYIFIFNPVTGVEGPKTPFTFATTGPIPATQDGIVYATVQLNGSVRVDSTTLNAFDASGNLARANTVRYFNEAAENFPTEFNGVLIRLGVLNGIWEFRAGFGFPVATPMNSFTVGHSTNPGGPIRYCDLTGSSCVFRFESGRAAVTMHPYFTTLRGVPIGVFLIPR